MPSSPNYLNNTMGDFSLELTEKYKLSGSNFLDWRFRMKSILCMKKLYSLVMGTEDTDIYSKRNKIDPDRKEITFEIIFIDSIAKLAVQFSAEANDNPMLLWKSIDKFYEPKTVQNQIMYPSRIFSSFLPKAKLEKALKNLENTQTLCIPLDNNSITSSIPLDSVVAMWKIINLPNYYKNTGKLGYSTKRESKLTSKYHNPLDDHSEEDWWKLDPEKQTENDKPAKALLAVNDASSKLNFVLDSGATTNTVNNLKCFEDIDMRKQEIELTYRSTIEALGSGTI
ncbi:hypothetical protein O181_089666 [Austropuccinia psidii MF-1]|uniref:Uncharacterized protein n=1 Tax=Austropuccinia psidii MF-1 TaxID=1389203 RepID=A0A9Q3P818_9BASI|nr:hypothetical protein [Austropuccinia psidii MF-1]